jgi:cobalt-zinc-cadmium efflux system membrane fusion protein
MSEQNRPDPAPRRLSGRAQLTMLSIIAAVALIAVFGIRLIAAPQARTPAATKPVTHNYFRATREQWQGITVGIVRQITFRPEVRAEGDIALDAALTTPVFSPYSGRVVKLIAKLGAHVDKGAPLMAVEATQIVNAENAFIAALSTLDTAKSQLNLAAIANRREHQLYLAKGAALKDWQKSEAQLIAAQNTLRTAKVGLAAARDRLRILGKSDKQTDALESITGGFSPVAEIDAPIAGTVTQRKVGLGQYISADASQPVYTIGNLSTVWLIARVRQEDAPWIRLGEPIAVRVLAYPGRTFTAKLSWIAPAIDPHTDRLRVRADVDNADGALKPGMFADFTIATGLPVSAPAVPADAVVYHGRRAQIWVAGKNRTLRLREIKVGRVQDGMVEVRAGLSPGEAIVTSGAVFIDRAARSS